MKSFSSFRQNLLKTQNPAEYIIAEFLQLQRCIYRNFGFQNGLVTANLECVPLIGFYADGTFEFQFSPTTVTLRYYSIISTLTSIHLSTRGKKLYLTLPHGEVIPYEQGMTFDKHGRPCQPPSGSASQDILALVDKISKEMIDTHQKIMDDIRKKSSTVKYPDTYKFHAAQTMLARVRKNTTHIHELYAVQNTPIPFNARVEAFLRDVRSAQAKHAVRLGYLDNMIVVVEPSSGHDLIAEISSDA